MNRIIFSALFLASAFSGFCQFQDNFDDGDFSSNPTWLGSTNAFVVNASNELQLMDTAGGTAFLYSAVPTLDTATWDFFFRLDFNPSTSNQLRIYLSSDSQDLSGDLNGYFLEIGASGSDDAIELYRQDGDSDEFLLSGTPGEVATNPAASVRVTRSVDGTWMLEADYSGGTNFQQEGSVIDQTYPMGSYFGFFCEYTETRKEDFYFDNITIAPLFQDVIPPILTAAQALDQNTVELQFDEVLDPASAEDASNYAIDNGITVNAANLDLDPTKVLLTVSALQNGVTYEVTSQNIEDLAGNPSPAESQTFSFFQISDALPFDILINEIMADPTPVVGLPDAEFIELYNRSDQTFDLEGYELVDEGSSDILNSYLLPPGSYVLLCDDADEMAFMGLGVNNILVINSFPSLTNGGETISLVNPDSDTLHQVSYSVDWYQDDTKDDGGWTLELINPEQYCIGAENWIASNDASGGTPGSQNAVFDNTPDITGPGLIDAQPLSNIQLELQLDEAVDLSATNPGLYSITPSVGAIQSVGIDPANASTILITIDAPFFQDQTTYTITLSNGVMDCLGNPIEPDANSAMFTYVETQDAETQDILINEIMADPTPVVGLPEAEFVELYNRSNKSIDLAGFEFLDASSSDILDAYILMPGEYVLLCDDDNEGDFMNLGITNLLPVESFPSLTNGGEKISLVNPLGDTIHQVIFSSDWYQDSDKEEGGWTLEQINPNLTCLKGANWIASNDTQGGTPGMENSVFEDAPDQEGPVMAEAVALSESEVLLSFNEVLEDGAANSGFFTITPDVGDVIVASFFDPEQKTILLAIEAPFFENGNVYTITATDDVTDCSGNVIQVTGSSISFEYTEIQFAERFDILINEIFPDPAPQVALPEAEFVELYNRSDKAINLEGYKFSDGSGVVNLPFYIIQPKSYLILCGEGDENLFAPFGNVMALEDFPSLTNSGEFLSLSTDLSIPIHEVEYSLDWYKDPNKDDGGWTLELINPNKVCSNFSNWSASNNSSGGTPGEQNSNFDDTPDLVGPRLVDAIALQNNRLRLTFDEALEVSALNPLFYSISGGVGPIIQFSNFEVNEFDQTIVDIIIDAPFFEDQSTYTITMDENIKDCLGNPIDADHNSKEFTYLEAERAEKYDLLINEIMANPRLPNGGTLGLPEVEYIELLNRSEKNINLNSCLVSNGNVDYELPFFILSPGDQVFLYKFDPSITEFEGFNNNLPLESFPGLPNLLGTIILKDTLNQVIHAVEYNAGWYRNTTKALGGWSLELINIDAPCLGGENWMASENGAGGTPGLPNSVSEAFPDEQLPELIRAFPDEDRPDQIRLFFDKALGDSSVVDITNYEITPTVGIESAMLEPPFFNTVLITLEQALEKGVVYQIDLKSTLRDCIGNPIGMFDTTRVAIPQGISPGVIIINELLFNPETGGSDFVELYNRSDSIFNIGDLIIFNRNEAGELDRSTTITQDYLLFPNEYIALTPDPVDIKTRYYCEDSPIFLEQNDFNAKRLISNALPTFPNDEGTIVLQRAETVDSLIIIDSVVIDTIKLLETLLIDEFYYQDDYHYSFIDDDEGVSLERLDPDGPTQDPDNWHSAAEAFCWGTPTYRNSQYFVSLKQEEDIFFLPEKTFSPDGDGYKDVLRVNYEITEPGFTINVNVYDVNGRLVKQLKRNEVLGVEEGFFTWDGSRDEGDKAPIGIYILWMELFTPDGEVGHYKETCVLAGQLD